MKQYFAYVAFTVCLVNAIIRPDIFNCSLVLIAALLVAVSMFQAETKFEKHIRELNQDAEKYYKRECEFTRNSLTDAFKLIEKNEEFFAKRLEETLRRIEEFEKLKTEIADTKRVVRDINLANTFVPRNKRGGSEL
jgi:hypothetical protein